MSLPKVKFTTTDRVFFTSDTHFGHKNILYWCPARADWRSKGVEAFDQHLLAQWNDTVRPEDTVVHLGDLSFMPNKGTSQLLDQLHGKKIILLGNHDNEKVLRSHPSVIGVYGHLNICFMERHGPQEPSREVARFHASHFPIWDWDGLYRGSYHIYGHTHGKSILPILNAIEVGVDCVTDEQSKYLCRPVSYQELLGAIQRHNEWLLSDEAPTEFRTIAQARQERVLAAQNRNKGNKAS